MRKGMVIQIVLIAFVLQLLAGITLYAASNGAVTMTNVTNGTILSVVKTKSGLVFSDSLNKTLTQQQLLSNHTYWVYNGSAWDEKAPYAFFENSTGMQIGVNAPKAGTWAGYFAESPVKGTNATLFHATITDPVNVLATQSYESGIYTQTYNGKINYIACTSLTYSAGTIWLVEYATGNDNEATNYTELWQSNSSAMPLTENCTIITNGNNYLKVYLGSNVVYSSNTLKLNIPGPYQFFLEPETSMNKMLYTTFKNYYLTTSEYVTVSNVLTPGTVKLVGPSGITLANAPVNGGSASLEVASTASQSTLTSRSTTPLTRWWQ